MKLRATGSLDVSSYSQTWGTDYAKAQISKGALEFSQLNTFILEILDQPQWRARADEEADYYDGNQYTAQQLSEMADRGIPPIVVNMTAPTINMVLGLEAKTRTDWVVKPELDEHEDAAAAMSQRLKQAERMSGADRAISDAYAGQVKTGVGWVEVGVNKNDPFAYRYRCQYVNRREIWWDWHDNDPLLKESRYLVRRKWYDEDVACQYFPAHKELIKNAVRGWGGLSDKQFEQAANLYQDMAYERDFAWSDEEWRDGLRKRICIYEVWYRTYEQGFVIRMRSGQVKEFDDQNPVHLAAVNAGVAQLEACIIPRMRLSFWIGPHRLIDRETPHPHNDFPYVAFWGFREDRTGAPYGMIRAMRPLQDEVNARRAKMLWQLSAKRVMIAEDAVSDHAKTAEEIARPDAYLTINTMKGKYNIAERIKVEDNSNLTAQQFEVYKDSKQTLQEAGGVYQQQLGASGEADSGIAISQLIEQGTTTLAEINDNAALGRMQVGNLLMAHIMKDMEGKEESISVERFGQTKKVKFNSQRKDKETGRTYLNNDVTRMQMSVVLADMPQTPTYRMQQFMELTKMVSSLPEQVQLAVIDIVINASDIPDKKEVLKRLRETLGLGSKPVEDMDEQELAELQAKQQQQQRQAKLADDAQAAANAKDKTQADLNVAKTELTLVQADALKVESNLEPELSRMPTAELPADQPPM